VKRASFSICLNVHFPGQDSVKEKAEEGGLSVQSEDVKAQDSSEAAPTELSESAIDSKLLPLTLANIP